jgi:hypothetical protein
MGMETTISTDDRRYTLPKYRRETCQRGGGANLQSYVSQLRCMHVPDPSSTRFHDVDYRPRPDHNTACLWLPALVLVARDGACGKKQFSKLVTWGRMDGEMDGHIWECSSRTFRLLLASCLME